MNFNEKDLSWLASFPEQNPNPVIEVSFAGKVTYCNPAAKEYFPDMEERGLEHPLFALVRERMTRADAKELNGPAGEVKVKDRIFEQRLFYMEGSEVVRVYANDVTERKKIEEKLSWLALFPEQNPNPVIEIDLGSNTVTYMNPAATSRFPGMKEKGKDHPLFAEIKKRIALNKDFQCEVNMDKNVFSQRVYFLPGTSLARVYSHDVTEQKQVENNLSRLASFPEQNPSPIIEVDLQGNITYFNPACLLRFPEFYGQKFDHPVLVPLKQRLDKFRTGEMLNYETEIKIGEHYYTQRARFLHDNGVIRMFNLDITQQKQNEETIREKNKDITDSINYAKKIQQAILPSEDIMKRNFPGSFILYQPRDIISGDFYWFTETEGYFIFVCADCTGHGVPGALMSMIGSNIVSDIVNEKKATTPGTVLAELDRRVRKVLRQDQEKENRDGMDMSFCALQKEKLVLHYSGANRPMVIIREGKIIECEPSKFPVGGQHIGEKSFAENKIMLRAGDRLYSFTDGITDQFGGPKGKKFMRKRFYELLLRLENKPMTAQREEIQKCFEDWKGALEQVDDVLVMGIEIT
ncbi:MAG TPA: SpoIIE family protein phosphatase [Bacteroidia bacterium]